MGCCSRDRPEKISDSHKWDYITLSDFKSTSCWSPFSYGILWIMLAISIAVYVVDVFTMCQLLLYDRWSGKIDPWLDLKYSRWIFTGCIILSFVLLVYRWVRAIRMIRTGGVAQSYLDPLAVRIQSIRMGERGRGWRRFLVFAELTKSKKGAEYVALFTYFSFEAWIRIVFAEGPRKVINAMTLYSIMTANLIPVGQNAAPKGQSPVAQFFLNVKTLAEHDNLRAAVLFGMLFTLIVWVFSAISLLLSCIFYITFLWHHIPTQDGSLRRYCKRKIDSRLQAIVDKKIKKAIAREDLMMKKQEDKARKQGKDMPGGIKREPTLPVLSDTDSVAPLTRTTTMTTTISDLERAPTVPMDPTLDLSMPIVPSAMRGNSSGVSVNSAKSNAPLMDFASVMGTAAPPRSFSPAPGSRSNTTGPPSSYSPAPSSGTGLSRNLTNGSMNSGTPAPGSNPYGPPMRSNTGMSGMSGPGPYGPPTRSNTGMSTPGPYGPPTRSNTDMSMSALGGPPRGPGGPMRPGTAQSQRSDPRYGPPRSMTADPFNGRGSPSPYGPPRINTNVGAFAQPNNGRASPALRPGPAPPQQEIEMRTRNNNQGPPPAASSKFAAYNPGANEPNSASTESSSAYTHGPASAKSPPFSAATASSVALRNFPPMSNANAPPPMQHQQMMAPPRSYTASPPVQQQPPSRSFTSSPSRNFSHPAGRAGAGSVPPPRSGGPHSGMGGSEVGYSDSIFDHYG